MCLSHASNSSEIIQVIIIKLGTVAASNALMHYMLIILTLTFIQGHTNLNYANNKCLIISKSIQAMTIKFAVRVVQLRVYMTIASLMTLTFIHGHKCASNKIFKYYIQTWHDLWMSYMLMFVLMTLTLILGRSGSAKAKNKHPVACFLQLSKQ